MMTPTIMLVIVFISTSKIQAFLFDGSNPIPVITGGKLNDRLLLSAVEFCKAGMFGFKIPAKKPCESNNILDPLILIFVDQTRRGGTGSKYQDNFANLAKLFMNQMNLADILSSKNDKNVLKKLTENLPDLAVQTFNGTGLEAEIRKSYEKFSNEIALELLLNLAIGRDTDPLFETNKAAIDYGFKGHPERQNILDNFDGIQRSFNSGKTDISNVLFQILKNLGVPILSR